MYFKDVQIGSAEVDSDGNYTISIDGDFKDGDEFRVEATDRLGTKTSDSKVASIVYDDNDISLVIDKASPLDSKAQADGVAFKMWDNNKRPVLYYWSYGCLDRFKIITYMKTYFYFEREKYKQQFELIVLKYKLKYFNRS